MAATTMNIDSALQMMSLWPYLYTVVIHRHNRAYRYMDASYTDSLWFVFKLELN